MKTGVVVSAIKQRAQEDSTIFRIILLSASREGDDQNGRQYVIRVSATDNAGNRGAMWQGVTVPHDLLR
jgi:hypothetical protein